MFILVENFSTDRVRIYDIICDPHIPYHVVPEVTVVRRKLQLYLKG
jgi:hypothetical protein